MKEGKKEKQTKWSCHANLHQISVQNLRKEKNHLVPEELKVFKKCWPMIELLKIEITATIQKAQSFIFLRVFSLITFLHCN